MGLLPFDMPATFLSHAERGEDWAAWVADVPRRTRELLDEWQLTVAGLPMHGHTALVLPVTSSCVAAVLKIAWPYEECRHEMLALQHWRGRCAVRLLCADPHRNGMLLERLHARDLTSVEVVDACGIIAGLFVDLHIAAPPQLDTLTAYTERNTSALEALPKETPLPRRIVEHAVQLGRDLADDPQSNGRLIHTDLHYENVLAGDRAEWLVIDPQPLSGDPHYEIAPMLSNRWDEVVASGDVRSAVRRRFHTAVDIAGLDEGRARDWVIVREAHNAMWAIEDGDPGRVNEAIAIIKAVQD